MKKMSTLNVDSTIGTLGLCARDGFLVRIVFGAVECTEYTDPVLAAARIQLAEYFEGVRRNFELPLMPEGTEFQKKVWNALTEIPYGETRTYSEVAESIGSPKAARAVGMANHVNPIPVIIPCHRVIGKSGKLVGYAGGLDVKTKLLEIEHSKT